MKRTGIEPVSSAWKADVLPLYQRSEEQLQEPGIEPGAQRWQRWILPLNHSCNSANLAACWKFCSHRGSANDWPKNKVYKD